MTERLNSAITALMTDNSLLSRFRGDPSGALERFGLSECELDAVKSGDEQALMAHGLAPEVVVGRPHAPHWFGGLVATVARRMAAPAVLAVLLALAVQGGGIPTASAGRANVRAVRRVGSMRTDGPLGMRRASVRARARADVPAIRAGIRARASHRFGVRTASSVLGVCKCDVTD